MSDPVTNAEIEDVLSSIRRLVSEEPTRDRARKTADKPKNDKFVLTPAFRVMQDDQREDDAGETGKGLARQDLDASAGSEADDAEQSAEDAGQADDFAFEEPVETAADQPDDDPANAPSIQPSETAARLPVDDGNASAGQALAPDDADDGSGNPEEPWHASAKTDVDLSELVLADSIDFAPQPSDAPLELRQEDALEAEGPAEDTEPQHREAAGEDDRIGPNLTLEQRIAELEAAIEQAPGEWEPDGSEDGDSDETSPIGPARGARAITLDSFQERDEDEPDGPPVGGPEAGDARPPEDAGETDPVAETGWIGIESVGFESSRAARSEPTDAEVPGPDTTAAEDEIQTSPTETETESEPTEDPPEPSARGFPAQDGEDETLAPDDTASPDDASYGADDAEDVHAAGVAEETSSAAADPEQRSSDPDQETKEPAFDLYGDDPLLDEEALRDLVSQLVREELQGVLGERITRNVRRLVRREIQRALAVREFE